MFLHQPLTQSMLGSCHQKKRAPQVKHQVSELADGAPAVEVGHGKVHHAAVAPVAARVQPAHTCSYVLCYLLYAFSMCTSYS